MRLLKNLSLLILVAAALCLSTSCSSKKKKVAPSSPGIISENYSFGTYKAEFASTLFLMDKAVRRACARARLTKTSHLFLTKSCEYDYIDIDKVPVSLSIQEQEETILLKIRIARFGDRESSEMLAGAIDEELRILTQNPPASQPAPAASAAPETAK